VDGNSKFEKSENFLFSVHLALATVENFCDEMTLEKRSG